jgi:hypothetical protein
MYKLLICVLNVKQLKEKMNSQIADLLKTQMILGGSGSWKAFLGITVLEKLLHYLPTSVPQGCCRRAQRVIVNKEIKSVITFEREKDDKKATTFFQNRMDAVIHSVSKLPEIRNLLSITHHDYIPHEFDPVQIDVDLYFQLISIAYTGGTIELLKFKLFCYEHENLFLQQYVESCSQGYDRHMANKLGTQKFFFDMMVDQKKPGIRNPLPSSHLVFQKHKFVTSRTFDNVFFEQKEAVRAHTEFFLERKDWYDKKGIPHTLGFMFHGSPGCGKTSTMKAIANVGNRHIINLHLSEIKSKEQLNHLFFNDEINVVDGGKSERYTIPVGERMYVIEDIDAMGDTVLRRELKKPQEKKPVRMDELGNIIQEEENPVDLSFLLNLLDGTLESSGRIIAISTNFPERIDSALIRPGRIDMIINFRKCSAGILREMIESFYDQTLDDSLDSLDYKWSPAEVNQILFRNFKDMSKAVSELSSLTPNELYGFPRSV